ncbi:IS1182 family transposase [Endozoicomonas montiporae CL-33]|uniref:IS1182 family transposase n=1 Tax=Endozoicomonas montiporae CL-33 TaxID=570277 RepID=A0A142BE21_9GAMM|nr:IS1182 family transposase [Endozoicomonas montiporae]AMO56997.1 IS1182 family transposase [Endozoicomonas montiporae CL-33]
MTTRPQIKINTAPQLDIFSGAASSPDHKKHDKPKGSGNKTDKRRFVAPNPNAITLGNSNLKEHLELTGQKTPFTVASLLDEQDWSDFEQRYASEGRPPYSPRNMMGLILYGIMQGITSLRTLERLARVDLGCMWVTGGIFPDHAIIGRFINMHSKSMAGAFFESLTRAVLKKTNSDGSCLAGDGTVIEAACSSYNLMKQEAAQQAHETAQKQADNHPDCPENKKKLEMASSTLEAVIERNEKRKKNGKSGSAVVSPTEPEAVVQKMKRGRGYTTGYKPSVLANNKRVVLAQAVDPTNETTVVSPMLDQSMQITGKPVDEMLLDAGYFNDEVISTSLERDISLLCPEGKEPGKPKESKKFQKGHFYYDETNDVYRCPAGKELVLIGQIKGSIRTKEQKIYGNGPCEGCPLKDQCTTNKKGRRIKRYAMDDAKDALRQVMQHPKAKKSFSKRKAMVEPVFAYLRDIQGLNRFRRKGLEKVKLEFGLHLLAYNLSRAVKASFQAIFRYNRILWLYFERYRPFDRKWGSWERGPVKRHSLQRKVLHWV